MIHSPKETEEINPVDKAHFSEPDSSKFMTFRHALAEGRMEQIHALLDDGLQPDVDFGAGVTPLHIAVQEGHTAVVRTLLARGANPNAMTGADWTPLHIVALTGNLEIPRLLFEHGAAHDLTTVQGHTPIDLAKIHKQREMIILLNKMGKRWLQIWK